MPCWFVSCCIASVMHGVLHWLWCYVLLCYVLLTCSAVTALFFTVLHCLLLPPPDLLSPPCTAPTLLTYAPPPPPLPACVYRDCLVHPGEYCGCTAHPHSLLPRPFMRLHPGVAGASSATVLPAASCILGSPCCLLLYPRLSLLPPSVP